MLHVHDDIVAETYRPAKDLASLTEIMLAVPDWAEGLPLDAEGEYGPRYKVSL